MKHLEFSFLLRAASPIAQHMGTSGNVGILNRESVCLPNGEFRDVPIVSGNAMRHGCRSAIVDLQLDALGLLAEGAFTVPDMVRFLYNGGTGASSESAVKLDEARAMRLLVPSTAILGGSGRGRMHQGQLEVESAMLVCDESAHLLADWQSAELWDFAIAHSSEYEALWQEFGHDEAVKPQGQFLLSEEARIALADIQRRREKAGDDGDEEEMEEAKGGMRPYSTQIVKRGSVWMWNVVGWVSNEREELTLRAMLSAFLRRAVVGGGRRVGRGRFELLASRGLDHLRPAAALQAMTDAELMGSTVEAPFLALLAERAEESRGWLLAGAGKTGSKAAKA